MTRQDVPRICDACGKEAKTGMVYKLQISQRGNEDTPKGVFIKANNDADMCHNCFLKLAKNGFKPDWQKLKKNEQSGKWEVVDDQTKIDDA